MLCLSVAQLLIVTITTLRTPSTQIPHFSGNERQAEIDLRQIQPASLLFTKGKPEKNSFILSLN